MKVKVRAMVGVGREVCGARFGRGIMCWISRMRRRGQVQVCGFGVLFFCLGSSRLRVCVFAARYGFKPRLHMIRLSLPDFTRLKLCTAAGGSKRCTSRGPKVLTAILSGMLGSCYLFESYS